VDIQLLGELGDDMLSCAFFHHPVCPVTYGPLNAVLLDGGLGFDLALFAAGQDAPTTIVGCEN
jgi:hypothetical protein